MGVAPEGPLRGPCCLRISDHDACRARIPQEEIGDDPAKFAERAKSDSDCPTGPNGGSLGFVVRAKLCEQFDEVVFNEEPGAVYGPVTTPAGLHLIFVHSCRDPTKKA